MMGNNAIAMNDSRPSGAFLKAAPVIDLADLASMVVPLDGPSREVDNIVEHMVGGDNIIRNATPHSVISGRWLSFETPTYTAGGGALSLLAHRRGYRIDTTRSGTGFRSTVKCLASGRCVTVSARSEGIAGVLAIIRLAVMELKNV